MSEAVSADDVREFNEYLHQCSDRQVQGVFDKERQRQAERSIYVELARTEAQRRGIDLDTSPVAPRTFEDSLRDD